jgi:membrane protease YdiL (CAAX protease family)
MKGALPILLLLLGGSGILLSFLRARSRAVFAQDGFWTPGRPATAGELLRRVAALLLLAGVLLLTVAIPFALGMAGTEPEARDLSYVSLFGVHATLALFLVCYYLLSGHRSVAGFLCLRSGRPLADLTAGIFVGLWYLLAGAPPGGEAAPASHVAPMIVWLVARPAAVKIAIICSAMFIEEFFFRSFLQTRVGPLAATLMFTAAHGAYGQPIVLIGILVISTVLSAAFTLYRNVLPCIVAHGVFDAIQMFVVIPLVLKALPV